MPESIEVVIARMESSLDHMRGDIADIKNGQQVAVGLVSSLDAVAAKVINLTTSVDRLWEKSDPLIHSDPPLAKRVRDNEDAILRINTRGKAATAVLSVGLTLLSIVVAVVR